MKTECLAPDSSSILRVAKLLSLNEVVALPTETVYGLAGNAFSEEAVQKIFTAKERPSFDPLIVHISERYLAGPKQILFSLVEDGILAPEILDAPELKNIHSTLLKYWPGPLTLILPRGPKIIDSITAAKPSVGIRCPAHPVFQAVLAKVPFPLAAPSANRFGRISPTESSHVLSELDGRISAVMDGGTCDIGVESTILKIDFPFRASLLRPGKISAEELAESLQTKVFVQGHSPVLTATSEVFPGSLDEHYAPRKPLYLMPHSFFETDKTREFLSTENLPPKYTFLKMHDLSRKDDLNEVAHLLFKALRQLDEDPTVEAIIADLPKEHTSGLGAAIADRLRRASRNKPEI